MEGCVQHPCPYASTGAASALFSALVTALMGAQCPLGNPEQYPRDIGAAHLLPEYDFIVIGAGSAGAVVASRLSEIPEWNVLLLEAGGDPSPSSDVPALVLTLQHTPEDWEYWSERDDKTCLGTKNKQCYWPRGKALGGSSTLNAMLYVRGNRNDYDQWGQLTNPQIWNYKEVLRSFMKSENNANLENKYHAKGGLMNVQKFYDHLEPYQQAILSAAEELGYPHDGVDVHGETQRGYMVTWATQKDNMRQSTAKSFLTPAKGRDNLHVSKNSHVTKLRLEGGRVTGVEFEKDGATHYVAANIEVILSAGAVNSPQILMLSGIGPREHLESLGIEVKHELPAVGQHLEDHFFFPVTIALTNLNIPIKDQVTDVLDNAYNYLVHKKGPLGTVEAMDTIGFINTPLNDNEDWPDMQVHHVFMRQNNTNLAGQLIHAFGYGDEAAANLMKAVTENTILVVLPTLLRPKSTGEIKLKSKDPRAKPLIYANYLSDPQDMKVMIEGVKYAVKYTETKMMKGLGAKIVGPLPSCGTHEFLSDEFWECMIRHLGTTVYHPTSTCRMGRDLRAVTDGLLRVRGLQGLRVADASVMPHVVSGNTNAPTIMVGERVADLIKFQYRVAKAMDMDFDLED